MTLALHKFIRISAALFIVTAGLAQAPSMSAAEPAVVDLQDISFTALPGDRVQIKLGMSAPPAQPISFTIDNPARIALDFPRTSVKLPKSSQPVGLGTVRSINAVEAKGRTRVVLNLDKLVPYETRIEGNDVYLTLDTGAAAGTSVAKGEDQPAAMAQRPAAGATAQRAIRNIDFRRGEKGEGRVLVALSDPATAVDIREEGGKIVAEFLNSSVPESLERRLDVTDFATPIQSVETSAHGNNVRMVISPTGEYEHLAYQAGDAFTIEVKPMTKAEQEAAKKEKFGYTGEKLSLNFQNIEVRAVLQLIADFTGLNIVTSDTVQGNLTLRLKNVPWDQALDIILKSKGLAMRQIGNVIQIAPTEEVAAREKLELEAQKQVEELAPLRSEFIRINYAKAADLAALLKAKENSLLSARGNVTVDERTNTLLIQDTADKLADVRNLVATLDIPQRQVLIESRVVIANDDFSKDLGVRFGASRDSSGLSTEGRKAAISGTLNGTTQLIRNDNLEFNDRLNVNLPANLTEGGGSIALALAKLPLGTLLELELSAMQAENRGEVISNPRVVTADKKEAFIEDGEEIPYLEASSSGAVTISFKKAVLSLKVKPQITPDKNVIMDLTVTQDTRGPTVTLGASVVPSIRTREVSTQVLVDNGETVVLGGTYIQTTTLESERIPFFGDLPYVGFLFKQTKDTNNKRELLIFVTPKILDNTLSLQ
ncbi:MAG: type IV pilus secretin PilQ [Pseudomonadota bacterium]